MKDKLSLNISIISVFVFGVVACYANDGEMMDMKPGFLNRKKEGVPTNAPFVNKKSLSNSDISNTEEKPHVEKSLFENLKKNEVKKEEGIESGEQKGVEEAVKKEKTSKP